MWKDIFRNGTYQICLKEVGLKNSSTFTINCVMVIELGQLPISSSILLALCHCLANLGKITAVSFDKKQNFSITV